MSDGDSPRGVGNVYYTRSVARAAVQRDSDSSEEETSGPVGYERLSPGSCLQADLNVSRQIRRDCY